MQSRRPTFDKSIGFCTNMKYTFERIACSERPSSGSWKTLPQDFCLLSVRIDNAKDDHRYHETELSVCVCIGID